MQEFTIANNATALKVFLEEYATDYFDSVDVSVDMSKVYTTCTKNGASTTIRCYTSSPNGIQINGTNTLTFSDYSSMRIAYAYVCDSAIVLIPVDSNNNIGFPVPICICKADNGDTMIVHPYRSAGSSGNSVDVTRDYFTNQDYTRLRLRVLALTSDGITRDYWKPVLQSNSAVVMGTAGIELLGGSGGRAENVWFVTHRVLYDHLRPFMLTLNGESYASFGYNSILVKTT